MSLTFRPIIDGFEAYDGDRKVAVIRTRGHDGMSYTSTIKKRHFAEDELPQNKQLQEIMAHKPNCEEAIEDRE